MSASLSGRSFATLVALLAGLWFARPASADPGLWALLAQGGQVVLIRHALTTPGVGDPPGFALADCKTQRNLSDTGRQEAQRLGAAVKARGIGVAGVLASPWCRTLETARIAFGTARPEPALANLFEHSHNRDRQLAAFRRIVDTAPQQGNLMLVTHGSTVFAFTGISPATSEMVVVTPEGGGRFRVAGRIPLADDSASPATPAATPSTGTSR